MLPPLPCHCDLIAAGGSSVRVSEFFYLLFKICVKCGSVILFILCVV